MSKYDWIEVLSKRGNLLYGQLDHISILLENIPGYVKDPGFNQQKLRDVYTIARAGHRQNDIVLLKPYDETNKIENIFGYCHQSFLRASQQEIRHNRVHNTKVVVNGVYKFYGTLKYENSVIIMDVHFILNVENPVNCLRTLALTSKICCQHYYQCYHSDRMKLKLHEWWDEFEKKKKENQSQTSQSQTSRSQTSQSQS